MYMALYTCGHHRLFSATGPRPSATAPSPTSPASKPIPACFAFLRPQFSRRAPVSSPVSGLRPCLAFSFLSRQRRCLVVLGGRHFFFSLAPCGRLLFSTRATIQDPGPALPGVLRSSGSLPGVPYISWLCTSKRTVYDLTVAGQLLRIGPDFLINHFIHRSSCVFALSSRLSFSASGPSVHYRTQ